MTDATSSEHPSNRSGSWVDYHVTLFPDRPRSAFIQWKVNSSGVHIATRLWDQREQLAREYEAEHGSDRSNWPTPHPGVVLDAVPWIARPACLGCAWLERPGTYMKDPGWFEEASERARQHQESFENP